MILQEFLAPEEHKHQDTAEGHEADDDDPVPEIGVGFIGGQDGKAHVHAVEAGNEGRRHEEHAHHGQDLHNFVLLQVDKTHHGILEVFQTLEAEVGMA